MTDTAALLARIDAMFRDMDRGDRTPTGTLRELLRDCRAALAERIPSEPPLTQKQREIIEDWRKELAGRDKDEQLAWAVQPEDAEAFCALYDAAVPGIPRERDAEIRAAALEEAANACSELRTDHFVASVPAQLGVMLDKIIVQDGGDWGDGVELCIKAIRALAASSEGGHG